MLKLDVQMLDPFASVPCDHPVLEIGHPGIFESSQRRDEDILDKNAILPMVQLLRTARMLLLATVH